MGAKNLLLTHFSQRYPKITDLNAKAAVVEGAEASLPERAPSLARPVIGLAFDFASIPIGSMWKMERYTPALEQLFAETADAVEDAEEGALIKAAMAISAAEPSEVQGERAVSGLSIESKITSNKRRKATANT